MQRQESIIERLSEDETNFNIQRFLGVFRSHLYWFIGSVAAACLVGFLYLRYSTPVFKTHATFLVQDEKRGGGMSDAGLLEDLGLRGKSNVDNEVEIFKSRTLMEKVVRDLQLNVRYFTEGRVKMVERFRDKAFELHFVPFYDDSLKGSEAFKFRMIDEKNFELKNEKHTWKGRWNDTLKLPVGKAFFTQTYASGIDPTLEYTITVNTIDATVASYMSSFLVAIPNKQVSTIDLTLETAIPSKGEVVLNKLIEVYLQSNVDDKNRIADSTMRFIDERLALVGEELMGIEKDIENFKETSGLTDLSAQSQALITNSSEYFRELSKQQVQFSI